MFDELSEDEMEMTSSSEVLQDAGATTDAVDGGGGVPVAPDWREEKIGVGPVEVSRQLLISITSSDRRRILESKNREEGNGKPPQLFSLDMMPIDDCFKDVLQQWPLRRQLPPAQ